MFGGHQGRDVNGYLLHHANHFTMVCSSGDISAGPSVRKRNQTPSNSEEEVDEGEEEVLPSDTVQILFSSIPDDAMISGKTILGGPDFGFSLEEVCTKSPSQSPVILSSLRPPPFLHPTSSPHHSTSIAYHPPQLHTTPPKRCTRISTPFTSPSTPTIIHILDDPPVQAPIYHYRRGSHHPTEWWDHHHRAHAPNIPIHNLFDTVSPDSTSHPATTIGTTGPFPSTSPQILKVQVPLHTTLETVLSSTTRDRA
jgi:hypothetical protein